jgi:hypothetical protein
MLNSEAAGRVAKEMGAEIRVIKKKSPEYLKEKDPPPCPSVKVNETLIAKNDFVSYETLLDAVLNNPG